MAGRVDETVYEAAQVNVAQAVPRAAEFRAHLERILASPAFRGSHRSREFLRHVFELALQGRFGCLKERILGIEIFNRHAEYDTSQDAIVRVTANDVRKRLIQYYAEAPAEEFRISLPSGSCIPEFSHSTAARRDAGRQILVPQPAAHPNETAEPPSSVPALVQLAPQVHETIPDLPVNSGPKNAFRSMSVLGAIAALIAVLSFSVGRFTREISVPDHSGLRESSIRDARYSFYKDLLGPLVSDAQMPTEVVISNPKLFLYRGGNKPDSNDKVGAVTIPLSAPFAAQLVVGANDTQADFPYHRLELTTNDYTGMGESKALFGIGRVLEAIGRDAHLSEARFLNWDAAHSEQLIVLGAPHMTKWTQNSIANANFTITPGSILNAHPLKGEQATYVPWGDGISLDDYGLIWMSQLPSGSRVLVLAGISSTGTAGVGSFFANPESMQPVYTELKRAGKGTMPPNWQVLLKINARDDVPVKVTPIAIRISQPSN